MADNKLYYGDIGTCVQRIVSMAVAETRRIGLRPSGPAPLERTRLPRRTVAV